MGFRRRTRRRALVVGAVAGGAMAHRGRASGEQEADVQAPAEGSQDPAQYAPPPVDPADEIEHLRTVARLGRALGRRIRGGQGEGPRVLNARRLPEDDEQIDDDENRRLQ